MILEHLKNSGSVMIKASNYNQWQYDEFKPYLKGKVLEIGCGAGNITELISQSVDELVSVDVKEEAVMYTKNRMQHSDKNIKIMQSNVFNEGSLIELGDFDTILFCNVLEHIEDDSGAMRYCYEYLKRRNGTLILLVPAHQFIYGTIDEEVGHHRRYNQAMVTALAEHSRFDVQKMFYFNFVGAIGWYVNYKLLKRKDTNNGDESTQISFFDRFCVKPTRILETIVRPPFGISIISIMRAD